MIDGSTFSHSLTMSPLAGLIPPDTDAFSGAVVRSDAEWRVMLDDLAYRVLRTGATEPAHSSPLATRCAAGTYLCRGCRAPLYPSSTKFDSGTGRPTFSGALPGAVTIRRSPGFLFARRAQCYCMRCDGYLGKMTEDGPPTTGQRHTLNGAALSFVRG